MQKESLKKIINRCDNLDAIVKNDIYKYSMSIGNNQVELKNIKSLLADDEDVREIFLKALAIKKKEMKLLETIVNSGLEFAYPDKDLEFRLEFVEKNNRVVPEFYLGDLLLKPPFKGDGGGVVSVIALLLYVAMVKLTGKKIVLLDEVESMVDIQASERLFSFLNTFAEKNNIKIPLITHKILPYQSEHLTDNIKLLKVGGHNV